MLQPLRPYWLALVLAYWLIEDPGPRRPGRGLQHRAAGRPDLRRLFGEQALRLVVMAFILQRFRARLRFFPMSQQALAIGGLLLNDRIVAAAIHLVLGEPSPPRDVLAGAAAGHAVVAAGVRRHGCDATGAVAEKILMARMAQVALLPNGRQVVSPDAAPCCLSAPARSCAIRAIGI